MSNKASHHHIDGLIESTERHWAWNYFVTQTMHLALALIREAIPGSASGLILPLQRKRILSTLRLPEDLHKVGRSLVGWVAENGSQHVFLASPPQFTYADDYHVERLSRMGGPASKDDPLLVMPRQIDYRGIESGAVEIIRFLFDFVYQHQEDWYVNFRHQVRDAFTAINTTHNGSFSPDHLLNDLMNIIIRLGGTTNGRERWRFCCMLLPQDSRLPPPQQNLFVYAQSKDAPHKVGKTVVSASQEPLCLSLRAYLSPHIHYIDDVVSKDTTIDFQEVEEPIHSAIALPIGGELGVAQAVLYIASAETHAFPQANRTILRLICNMVGNLLINYRTQQKLSGHLIEIIRRPDIIDLSFDRFLSENDFRRNVRTLLEEILENEQQERLKNEEISFIAIGIDKQEYLALRYGSDTLRNLYREMGLHMQGSARAWFTQCELYHIYADKFYLLLKDITFEKVQIQAKNLKKMLDGSYRIDARYISADQLVLPGQKLLLEDLTVHLTFTSYTREKLSEILHQHKEDINTVSLKMRSTLEDGLRQGENAGGNTIVAWSRERDMFLPSEVKK